jgi:hypothetical protein
MKLMRVVRHEDGELAGSRPGSGDVSAAKAGVPSRWPWKHAARRLAVACLTGLLGVATAYGRPASPGLVTLAWNASADPTVAGYHLYFGGVTGNYTNETDVSTNTQTTVTNLFTGATYYFTATSYNAAGIESTPAPEVSWTVLPTTPATSVGLSATGLTYGQPLSAATISGVMTNALGTVIPGTFAFSAPALVPAAGTYTGSVIFTPTAAIDYTTATNNVAVTVSPAPLTITALNAGKTYGQAFTFAGTEFAATGLVNGDKITTVAMVCVGTKNTASVGGYAIVPGTILSGSFNPANYIVTRTPGALTVTPAALTVTAAAQSKTYGQGQNATGYTGSRWFTASGLQNGELIGTVTLAISNNGGAAMAGVAGSPYTITPSAATGGTFDPANYSITYVPASLTVTPAPLTVTAMNQYKVYGQTMTFGGGNTMFTAGGLKNGEMIGTVTLTDSNHGGAATASVAGSPYLITPSAATGGTFNPANYAISYVSGSLAVNWTEAAAADTAVFINPPVELNDGTFQLTFTGGNAGVNYAVQGSADLVNWTTLTNLMAATNGLPAFVDVSATNTWQRFYRTVTP